MHYQELYKTSIADDGPIYWLSSFANLKPFRSRIAYTIISPTRNLTVGVAGQQKTETTSEVEADPTPP